MEFCSKIVDPTADFWKAVRNSWTRPNDGVIDAQIVVRCKDDLWSFSDCFFFFFNLGRWSVPDVFGCFWYVQSELRCYSLVLVTSKSNWSPIEDRLQADQVYFINEITMTTHLIYFYTVIGSYNSDNKPSVYTSFIILHYISIATPDQLTEESEATLGRCTECLCSLKIRTFSNSARVFNRSSSLGCFSHGVPWFRTDSGKEKNCGLWEFTVSQRTSFILGIFLQYIQIVATSVLPYATSEDLEIFGELLLEIATSSASESPTSVDPQKLAEHPKKSIGSTFLSYSNMM